MDLSKLALDHNIIHLSLHVLTQLRIQNDLDNFYNGRPYVSKPRAYIHKIMSPRGDKTCLRLVIYDHPHLAIVGVGIEKVEPFIIGCGIHDLVDARQW